MGRAAPRLVRILALLAALALAPGCKGQLEKHASALARANFNVDRIAVAGVVSNQRSLKDPPESRERWSVVVGEHLGRGEFGSYPIVSSAEVRAHPHLVALRHVVHPARDELERRHPVHPGVGAVAAARRAPRRNAAALRPPAPGPSNGRPPF